MKARDYIKKRAELESDYRTKVAALETVWALFHPDEPAPSVATDEVDDADLPVSRRKAVREVVVGLEGTYSVKEVKKALEGLYPAVARATDNDQLSSLIARLAADGTITVVKDRSGRTPGTYATPQNDRNKEQGDESTDF